MTRAVHALPLSLLLALGSVGSAFAAPPTAPRPCATIVCAAPSPDMATSAPAILAVLLTLGLAAWMNYRARRRA